MTWLTDRSRYTTGLQHCMMARYLNYHAGDYGYGWSPAALSVPLSTGIYVHEALAGVLTNGEPRLKINEAVERYTKAVTKLGYSTDETSTFTIKEQAHLIEALCWGWVRLMLPMVLENFEILDVEREELKELTNVTQMSKPDFIARDKRSGKVEIHDFKTTGSMSPNWRKSFRNSVQMSIGAGVVSERLGEEVINFRIHGLAKGGRRKFTRHDNETEEARNFSHLCYVQYNAPEPPMQPRPEYLCKGYWYDKTPVWELDFPDKPAGISNAEHWANTIPLEDLVKMYEMVGPYPCDPYMEKQYYIGMEAEEQRWINRLWELPLDADWPSDKFQDAITNIFARSYQCESYFGEQCPYKRLCLRRPGWEDPVGSGYYKHRRPHHADEIEQMEERGIPVEKEEWNG